MKKLFLSMAVALIAAGAFTSCGSKASTEATDEGDALKAKIENCTNSDSLRIYVEQAQTYAQKLEADGKGAEAEAYISAITPVIQKKDPSVASYFEELKSKAKGEVEKAKADADSVANAAVDGAKKVGEDVKDAGKDAVSAAKDAGENAVNKAREKGSQAVDAAKNAGENAVEKGKEKTSEAVQKGADKVKNLIK
ncbi:MAG: hypothetical protein NC328_08395 [Muribaculum sp.]|nr:hypothetical protein [Muribaculum sp.]